MVSKVEEILAKCNGKIECNRFKLVIWSFMNDFKELQKVSFGEVDDDELNHFVEICDNRLNRSQTFLNDIAVVLGFDLLALSIVATISDRENMLKWLLPFSGIVTVGSLFVILTFLFVLLVHYRSQVHAWTAFKEKAILMKQRKGQ